MTLVYWDTMLFTYWFKGQSPCDAQVEAIYNRMQERGDRLCTGIITVAELLVVPEKAGDSKRRDDLLKFFDQSDIDVLPFDIATAKAFAKIRASSNAKAPDAIHLACAATAGVDLFLTNDKALRKLVVPGIGFIDDLNTTILGLSP